MSGGTSLRFNFLQGKDTASPHMQKMAANATAMSATMRAASALATVGMVTLGAAVLSVAAHVIALGQSAIVASGALALLPSALSGLIGVGVAAVGVFSGLGEAWKQVGVAAAAGGGGGVDAARQVEMANRHVRDATVALADAQRAALAAQEAVTRAREEASERLEDLSRSLRGARLDERSATEALKDARQQLAAARGSGDASEVRKAQIAYERAGLSLEEVRDKVSDLSKESEQANAKGVEGSENVQSALQRQEESQRQLTAATERLADAQRELANVGKGGASASAKAEQALAALAPSARAVVLELKAMGPAWSAARKGAQQAAFEGIAGLLNSLSTQYLPRVSGWLYRMGDAFNAGFRDVGQLALSNKFARDFGTSLEFIDQMTRNLMMSLRPVINGLMQFVAVGSSFLPGISADVGGIAERFERWAVAARESGQMQQWISDGMTTLGQFWAVAKNLVMTLVAIFKAGENTGTLTGLVSASEAMRKWAESAEGQEKIASVLTFLRDIFTNLSTVVPAFTSNADLLVNTMNVFGVIINFVASNLDTFAAILPYLIVGLIVMKSVQTAANAATVLMIPLRIAEFIATLKSTAAMRAHTLALTANTAMQSRSAVTTGASTVATTAGDVATKRSLVSLAAMKIAQGASAVATGIATAAQWALNASWYGFPVVWIIAAIIALIAIIVLVIMYHEEIWAFVKKVWANIWDGIKAFVAWIGDVAVPFLWYWLQWPFKKAWEFIQWVYGQWKLGMQLAVDWIVEKAMIVINFWKSAPGKIREAASNLWEGLVVSFKTAINTLIRLWNNFSLTLGGGNILGLDIPSITLNTPDIPYLDTGGRITGTGLAVVHRGEEVVRAAEVGSRSTSGGSREVVELRSDGSAWSDLIIETIRKAVGDRGGDVQIVLGR